MDPIASVKFFVFSGLVQSSAMFMLIGHVATTLYSGRPSSQHGRAFDAVHDVCSNCSPEFHNCTDFEAHWTYEASNVTVLFVFGQQRTTLLLGTSAGTGGPMSATELLEQK